MIVTLAITALLAGLDSVITLLPTFTFPEPHSYTTGIRHLHRVNDIIPVATLAGGILLTLVVEGLLRGWDFAVWVYHQLWGSS